MRIEHRNRRRRHASWLAAAALLTGGSAALARDTDLTGHWVGKWNGAFFVEYVVTKADRKALSGSYGFKPDGEHEQLKAITCRAIGEYAYDCGASQITFTSTTSADAVMHTPDGKTLTTELTR